MPDVQIRFHKDMLVLSSPVEPVFIRQGFDPQQSLEFAALIEPEAVHDALRLNKVAGAQCLVTNTEFVTPARLARVGLEDRAADLISQGLQSVVSLQPQHILFELGPTGLPLDASSKNSLNESREQYARVGRMLQGASIDAVFLNGFTKMADLQCALMGMRQVLDCPVFASVDIDEAGTLDRGAHTLEDVCALMEEYGASVAGIRSAGGIETVSALVCRMTAVTQLPLLVSLQVNTVDKKQGAPTQDNPYYCADTMIEAAVALRAAGAQFLRACGNATPAYTGALVAASEGFDVARVVSEENE